MQTIRLPATLTDGEIVLDGYTIDDVDAHLQGEDDEMLRRFDSAQRATLEQTRAAITRWIDGRAAGGPMFAYAIRQSSRRLVGGCEIRLLSPDRANVSYWIYSGFRNRGYATRALALLCESAAQIDGLRQLEAHIDADNAASRRLAARAGFVEAGTVADQSWAGVVSTRLRYVRRVIDPPAATAPLEAHAHRRGG